MKPELMQITFKELKLAADESKRRELAGEPEIDDIRAWIREQRLAGAEGFMKVPGHGFVFCRGVQ